MTTVSKSKSVTKAYNRGLDFLIAKSTRQLTTSTHFQDKKCTQKVQTVNIILPVALALHALSINPQRPEAVIIQEWKKKISAFLVKTGQNHSYNYWIPGSSLNKKYPLPDDLDDTALCLSALLKNKQTIDDLFFLKIIQIEQKVGGPYYTWYVNKADPLFKKWLDIDPMVNANLLYLASLYGIKLPRTEQYLVKLLKGMTYHSPYYPYKIIFLFYLSRYAKTTEKKGLQKQILSALKKYSYNQLELMEKIFYSLTLAYLEPTQLKITLLKPILEQQHRDGSFPALPFCYDFPFQKKKTFNASPIITTALVCELLALILPQSKPKIVKPNPNISKALTRQANIINKELAKTGFKKEILTIFPDVTEAKALLGPISLALNLKPKLSLKDLNLIDSLSIAILFGWLGYTINDEILDQQQPIENIPLANTLIRLSWFYYFKVIDLVPSFQKVIEDAFTICDQHYVWEGKYTHFTKDNQGEIKRKIKSNWNYNYIANRMQPYLVSMQYLPRLLKIDPRQQEPLYNFFKSQMIIDQLNDDAHDWQEDQEAGILTYVLKLLYQEELDHKKHPTIFWKTVMPKIIKVCRRQYNMAQKSIEQLNKPSPFLKKLLEQTYFPIKQADEERQAVLRIIENL